ncbi:MAG TPA: HipA domain-containing protein [Fimbriimonadaceae bacterium]|nr:HipA domain-containing protein [Fimbriimonadaceae bacterium]
MFDPKRVAVLDVLRDREKVGELTRTDRGAIFRYTDEFLGSDRPPAALHLPKRPAGVEAGGTANLPPFFAGLLPEGVMQEAVARSTRLSRDDYFSLLAVTGYDAVGDVTIRVPGEEAPRGPRNAGEVKDRIERILKGNRVEIAYTVSGIQPKLSIGQAVASMRGSIAIVKIEPPQYPGLLANEAYFMKLASKSGIPVPRVRLEEGALIVERFDRIKRRDQPPQQVHVEDALQIMDKYPSAKYSLDYLEIMDAAHRLGVAKSVLLDLLRLYAYSFAIGNGDLHAKNVSFQYRSRMWRLTPAYDLVCTIPYFEADAFGRNMVLPLDEQYGDFTARDFTLAGERYALPAKAVASMLAKVGQGVLDHLDSACPVAENIQAEIRARGARLLP